MPAELARKWMALVLGAVVLSTGCVTVTPPAGRGALLDRNPHEEKAALKPLPTTPFDSDDVDSATVTKLFRVRFDRNLYSVPPHLVGQSVLVRGTSQTVSIFLGPKCVATHERCWSVGEDVEDSAHRAAVLATKPRAGGTTVPPALECLGEVGRTYLSTVVAGTRSLHREVVRLTFLCEVFGASTTADAMGEVMRSGHVGAEYVEYVLRHRRGLTPAAPPLKLGRPRSSTASLSPSRTCPSTTRSMCLHDCWLPAPCLTPPPRREANEERGRPGPHPGEAALAEVARHGAAPARAPRRGGQ